MREHSKRSILIQKAVKLYLELKRKRQLNDLLKEGYAEMADESAALLKEFQALGLDSLKHAD